MTDPMMSPCVLEEDTYSTDSKGEETGLYAVPSEQSAEPSASTASNVKCADTDEPVSGLMERLDRLEELICERERERARECEALMLRMEEINRLNRENSAGSVKGAPSEYFSPAEVREMTPAQVRKNYSRIVDSMGKWN